MSADADAREKPAAETRSFEAEVSRLLSLMVHSVYSNRDVFLRELISNAADACEKLRTLALEKPELLPEDNAFKITLSGNAGAGTLTIEDNGIGMDRRRAGRAISARSRARARAPSWTALAGGEGSALIGQFGVGFYSAFMAAAEVEVISRRADGEEAWRLAVRRSGHLHDRAGRRSTRRRRAARGWC